MPEQVLMLFETDDLASASPATVSRCGVVYTEPSVVGWRSLVASWLQTQQAGKGVPGGLIQTVAALQQVLEAGPFGAEVVRRRR